MDKSKLIRTLKPSRILYPILIGFVVAIWLLYKDFDSTAFLKLNWTWHAGVFGVVAIIMMLLRDIAYMYRIRILTDKELSWKKSFQVIMLWEFASAITPSIVGGSAIAIFIVHKEISNIGKSTAIVMVSSMLDELFYIIMVPILYFAIGGDNLFSIAGLTSVEDMTFGYGVFYFFIFGYLLMLTYTLIILYALFSNPRLIKWVFIKLFSLPFLRKRRTKAAKAGDDLIIASKEIKGKPKRYWVKTGIATLVSWTARFWVVNFLILIPLINGLDFYEHILIYGRQLLMWVIMLVSPTPGGSGFAEVVFSIFLGEFIPKGLSASMALIWRLISYYPYLIIGAVILPIWIKRVFSND